MFLKSGEVAFTGLMTALAVLLIILSGVLENCSLFLLAAASFLTGVVKRRVSMRGAAAFLLAGALLGFLLAPNKLYCFTFLAFCVYVLFAEWCEKYRMSGKSAVVWIGKAIVYHILLLGSVAIFQYVMGWEILMQAEQIQGLRSVPVLFVIVLVIAAEVLWLLFDRAYFYFQRRYGHLFQAGR